MWGGERVCRPALLRVLWAAALYTRSLPGLLPSPISNVILCALLSYWLVALGYDGIGGPSCLLREVGVQYYAVLNSHCFRVVTGRAESLREEAVPKGFESGESVSSLSCLVLHGCVLSSSRRA